MVMLTAALMRATSSPRGSNSSSRSLDLGDYSCFVAAHRVAIRSTLTLHVPLASVGVGNGNERARWPALTLGKLDELHALTVWLCELERHGADENLGRAELREYKRKVRALLVWLAQLLVDPKALSECARAVSADERDDLPDDPPASLSQRPAATPYLASGLSPSSTNASPSLPLSAPASAEWVPLRQTKNESLPGVAGLEESSSAAGSGSQEGGDLPAFVRRQSSFAQSPALHGFKEGSAGIAHTVSQMGLGGLDEEGLRPDKQLPSATASPNVEKHMRFSQKVEFSICRVVQAALWFLHLPTSHETNDPESSFTLADAIFSASLEVPFYHLPQKTHGPLAMALTGSGKADDDDMEVGVYGDTGELDHVHSDRPPLGVLKELMGYAIDALKAISTTASSAQLDELCHLKPLSFWRETGAASFEVTVGVLFSVLETSARCSSATRACM